MSQIDGIKRRYSHGRICRREERILADLQMSTNSVTELRRAAFPVIYRMVGSVAEAEDLIQEGLLRFQMASEKGPPIANARAFLVSVTTRLAIDHLRSARHKREVYTGEWLPEPIVESERGENTLEQMEMAETLSMAFLVLLETLSPLERAVFLLRQVFDYEYAEIAEVVGKSESNCRQVFSRAKRHVAERKPRFETSKDARDSLAHRFLEVCKNGTLADLESMLAADVEFHGDGGGVATAVLHPVIGNEAVARLMHGIFSKAKLYDITFVEATVNGQPGILAKTSGGELISVMALQIVDGKIQAFHSVINPDKLTHLGQISDLARLRKPQR
jgi:RNA polymerase sigma-70 factor, ECF subfamily